MSIKIQHIGLACNSIDEALETLNKVYGAVEVKPRLDASERIGQISALVKVGDNLYFELMEPAGEVEGVVGKYLNKKGPGFHHIGLHVTDLDEVSKNFDEAGVTLMGKKTGDGGTHAFASPKVCGGVLYELAELADLDREV